ncbi:MAG TPA: arginine repressor [Blastocatellia bacterium]
MKQDRQQKILDIVGSKPISTQQQLAVELKRRGMESTQSSVSRDIARLGLVKINGAYAAPHGNALAGGPLNSIEPAGDNLIVVKTDVGQAQHAALRIDWANLPEIIGTVAGDDTILVVVKNMAAQRIAIKRILGLFIGPAATLQGQKGAGAAGSPSKKRAWA